MTTTQSIAIIDDEPAIRRLLSTALQGAGYRVLEADSGTDGLVCVAQRQPDAVLLDLGLPSMDGIEVLRRLREWSDVPVIIITVRDDPDEKISVLDNGADDFITKPFHTGELLARIRSVLKRTQPATQESILITGNLHIDFLDHKVTAAGHRIDLTPIEYRILQTLARYHGKIVTKSILLKQVWGSATSSDEHLRVHLAAIRKKLRVYDCDRLIVTEPGVGYRLNQSQD